ncbi:MAG: hypothetical protein ACOY90_03505, partial [Candidatus Zhuqueibacterota bacterium]
PPPPPHYRYKKSIEFIAHAFNWSYIFTIFKTQANIILLIKGIAVRKLKLGNCFLFVIYNLCFGIYKFTEFQLRNLGIK